MRFQKCYQAIGISYKFKVYSFHLFNENPVYGVFIALTQIVGIFSLCLEKLLLLLKNNLFKVGQVNEISYIEGLNLTFGQVNTALIVVTDLQKKNVNPIHSLLHSESKVKL